ncbi:MAG: acyl carrier protein [Clostridium sp.]|nr:acyl carrier protein [Clostridium sp.]
MIFNEIKEIICSELQVEEEAITMETTFEDLGADSLDLFQVVVEIEEKYGIQIEEPEKIKSIKDVMTYVEEQVK